MIATNPEKILLNAKEAATALSISPRSLWSLTASRELPAVRIGRSVRYSVDDLKEFIELRRTTN